MFNTLRRGAARGCFLAYGDFPHTPENRLRLRALCFIWLSIQRPRRRSKTPPRRASSQYFNLHLAATLTPFCSLKCHSRGRIEFCMAAPKEILNLVKRFDENREAFLSGAYSEAQVRIDFIDPFFAALGWDIRNERGKLEPYREVIHEDSLRIGGSVEAPDLCFRIGNTRKFFVECKKPSVNLKEGINPAYQLRRYAWSAKLPFSILTDFEEFIVYDCRTKPKENDSPKIARHLYLTYKDYPAKWDEIAAVFSREAVLSGSFDKYAQKMKGKRGAEEVDDDFLEQIERWRESLAKNIAFLNPKLTVRELNFAVQQTIDRIIFLRICEDREIESFGSLRSLLNGNNIYKRLMELFYKADHRYNSGLFHFSNERGRDEPPDELSPTLSIDDKPLKEVFEKLYYPSPYAFSVIPADILGHVYERFLGKVISLTKDHNAKVEEKPEVRKAGGVYYTPTYIVDYIVKNTVGKLLDGKTPKQAEKLKILDPACGSGSFLIGAYQYLIDWHRNWYFKDGPQKHQKVLYQTKENEWFLTTAEKKRILINNIFGVDIDTQAVEVTKLSLLLKVLENENEQTLEKQLKLLHERALPDLSNNIKCGNSLIGPDFYEHQQLSMLADDERYRINVFDWDKAFQDIMKSGGFDAVIGNPPYGAYLDDTVKEFINSKFTFQNYQLDSYLLFLEKSIKNLLRKQGFYAMIVPNPWLTNLLQKNTRKYVACNTRIIEIVHFKFPVFPKVTVDTQIVILQNSLPNKWIAAASIVESLDAFEGHATDAKISIIKHKQEKWCALNGGVINIFLTPEEEQLRDKCLENSNLLEEYFDINVGIKPYQVGKGIPPQTKQIVENRVYDSEKPADKQYRQYLRGRDIGRYYINPTEMRYIKYGQWLAEPRPAANFDAPSKIFMRQTGDSLVAALDTSKYLCLNNMHVMVPKNHAVNINYILGIINSRLLNWYYHTLNPEVGEALAEVKRANVAQLPIHKINSSSVEEKKSHDSIVKLVSQLLALYNNLNSSILSSSV